MEEEEKEDVRNSALFTLTETGSGVAVVPAVRSDVEGFDMYFATPPMGEVTGNALEARRSTHHVYQSENSETVVITGVRISREAAMILRDLLNDSLRGASLVEWEELKEENASLKKQLDAANLGWL